MMTSLLSHGADALPPGSSPSDAPVDDDTLDRADGPSVAVTIAYQPIADVARGVVAGYQAQAQFAAADLPQRLEIAAPSVLGHDLDGTRTASVAARALSAMPTLPPNTFLTVPLGVDVAGSRAVRRVLLGAPSLERVVLDIVGALEPANDGETPTDTVVGTTAALERYRAAGALIAVGGYGTAQPELTSIVRLHPSILRLGRDWIRGVDRSSAKRSAVEVIGQLAGQLDAWVLAEGVCTAAELRTLASLGVPLAQGPFVGGAREVWPALDLTAQGVLPRVRHLATAGDAVLAHLVQQTYTATDAASAAAILPETSGFDTVVIVDEHGRPVTVLEQIAAEWDASPVLAINVNTDVREAVQRAVARPRLTRFTPLACTDDAGKFLGILRIERLMNHLAADPD
jgi:hypothetical protein